MKPATLNAQPVSQVKWVHRSRIAGNDYNPNSVAPTEMALLKRSILEDGWTQPIVVYRPEGADKHEIIDGFHRWTISGDPEVAALTDSWVPVVFLAHDESDRMLSTVRHNRARGTHGVLPMSAIVRRLLESGMTASDVSKRLGMDKEEITRLANVQGLPVLIGSENDFAPSWKPGDPDAEAGREATD